MTTTRPPEILNYKSLSRATRAPLPPAQCARRGSCPLSQDSRYVEFTRSLSAHHDVLPSRGEEPRRTSSSARLYICYNRGLYNVRFYKIIEINQKLFIAAVFTCKYLVLIFIIYNNIFRCIVFSHTSEA